MRLLLCMQLLTDSKTKLYYIHNTIKVKMVMRLCCNMQPAQQSLAKLWYLRFRTFSSNDLSRSGGPHSEGSTRMPYLRMRRLSSLHRIIDRLEYLLMVRQ